MSSVYDGYQVFDEYAERANDGIYHDEAEYLGSMAHTNEEANPWWRVDLGRVHCIYAVRILNRG